MGFFDDSTVQALGSVFNNKKYAVAVQFCPFVCRILLLYILYAAYPDNTKYGVSPLKFLPA